MTTAIQSKYLIKAGDVCFTFLKSGDLFEAAHQSVMINQWLSNPIDGSLNNLYVRIHTASEIRAYPMLGSKSGSTFHIQDSHAIWKGMVEEISYQVTFSMTEAGIWFWEVELDAEGITADIIYGQDLGLAHRGAVRTNEAFVSQYIDHQVFQDERKGYIVCSRQNQPQDGTFPYLQQGSLTQTIGYSTDGFQFFGLSYKETNEPEALKRTLLANEVYQYEFAYTALQSKQVDLKGKTQFVFYGLYKEDHPEAIRTAEYETEVWKAWKEISVKNNTILSASINDSASQVSVLKTYSITPEELDLYFPCRIQEEWQNGKLLSFFTETYEHIVFKEKELLTERPHGHILMSGNNIREPEKTMTSTSHMYGIFNSQLTVGNTSFNKMLSNQRNALNIMKTSGQRLYVEMDGSFYLLGLPSLFEMGFNYARWYYKTANDLIIVTNTSSAELPEIQLDIRSAKGLEYRYLVTNQMTMNNNEYDASFQIKKENGTLIIQASEKSESASVYPDLTYLMKVWGTEFEVIHTSDFDASSVFAFQTDTCREWSVTFQGQLDQKEPLPLVCLSALSEIESYREFLKKTMNGFRLTHPSENVEKVNVLAWWYTHNMLVHYSVPHGLEQYGGAAWGTRDVCQGPAEFFMATQNYEAVRNIIKTIFSHQYEDNGNWPQWFMFDRYASIQQEESHGDIIVWPLKVLSDYLLATDDSSILHEDVPYTDRKTFQFTEKTVSIYEHAKKEIQYIKDHFLHNTHLSMYGDGDWDDTLQPANAELKQYMVSSWTVALTYQTVRQFSQALIDINPQESAHLMELASSIKDDFTAYMLNTSVIPGFIYLKDPLEPELMLHPEDTKTKIQYRLLPMTRSMIAELLSKEQAEAHYQLIKEKLFFTDGVRLMNRPAEYRGGVSTHFKRAEQAANFGREVGLQYVHAHIRYVEAMAKLGKTEEVWNGLETINPVGITGTVKNAALRQSNAYFSSSDGKFPTRLEAEKNFEDLKNGSVPVKGGWRIYSSGPGIYLNQLLSNCLGIRFVNRHLVLDPVLPENLNGLRFSYTLMKYPVQIVYHLNKTGLKRVSINGHAIQYDFTENPYREGGLLIKEDILSKWLKPEDNLIEIDL
ncbi:GH36-type glycosyl hydrolase domain-containing protein [Metabacillus sp. RGM 3146]|uniref:GH36-type glycosyl hydrolase domain-containing protein n=1 Tax=Metabacillus sp. RGM 3146 TaxID=3401092 RepID=UPI003B99E3BE